MNLYALPGYLFLREVNLQEGAVVFLHHLVMKAELQ